MQSTEVSSSESEEKQEVQKQSLPSLAKNAADWLSCNVKTFLPFHD